METGITGDKRPSAEFYIAFAVYIRNISHKILTRSCTSQAIAHTNYPTHYPSVLTKQ